MKIIFAISLGCLFSTLVFAQNISERVGWDSVTGNENGRLREKERGANFRTYERLVEEVLPDGTVRSRIQPAYTEIASGIHYFENGKWQESVEIIEPFEHGAIARKGQHKVTFSPNLATAGAIDMQMPDGKRFRSHLLGLSYYDEAADKSYLIAEVSDCEGEIVNGNQVIYRNAFKGIRADVRYTYTKGGFEQDVILLEQPPLPEAFGLSTATTRLQVFTEFLNPPQPTMTAAALRGKQNAVLRDETLDFGSLVFSRGNAFLLDAGAGEEPVPVGKQWRRIEGRDFLIEEVHIRSVTEELDRLPAPTQEQKGAALPSRQRMAQTGQVIPPRLAANRSAAPMQIAALSAPRQGFVMDYVTSVSATNYTFLGFSTYYVSGTVNLSGTNYVEPGVVFKFANSSAAKLNLNGPLQFKSEPYMPVVFTVKDDNSVGEAISGSSGNPSTYAAVTFLNENSGADNLYRHSRFTYAGVAVAGTSFSNGFWHAQFYRCNTNVSVGGSSGKVALHNVLASRANVMVYGDCTVTGEHVTADQCNSFAATNVTAGALTNSILTAVTNLGNITLINCAQASSGSGVYQAGAWGNYYLASGSTNRDAGVTNISAEILADLAKMTTYPPITYSNVTLTNAMTFSPQAQRDGSQPDRGYHYLPLDYVFAGINANENLTFSAGTVVGWYRTSQGWYHAGHGIHMGDTKVASFEGALRDPAWWVRCNTVQETGNQLYYGPGGITGWAYQYGGNPSLASEVRLRFSKCVMIGQESANLFRDDTGYLTVRSTDSEFYGAGWGGYAATSFITNCFFYKGKCGNVEGVVGNELTMINSTMFRGQAELNPWRTAIPLRIKNCAFDQTLMYLGGIGVTDYDYNAYLTNAQRLSPTGAHDVIVSNYNWQTGPLGTFYLPTNSALLNAGSMNANLLGLYHYTTTTNQVKEINTTVDIGYHYVALNGGCQPVDTDGDGIPDYAEDANGNGQYDVSLDVANWLSTDSDGDGLPDSWEFLYGLNPSGNDAGGDFDGDGVNNLTEFRMGRNPAANGTAADTGNLLKLRVFTRSN